MPTVIPVVPAKDRRHLHLGDRGNDVKAFGRLAARTLRKNTYYTPVNAQNGVFGDGLLKDTIRLQSSYGIKPTGVVDLATWQAVDPQMHAYERLLLKLPTPKPASNGQKIAHEMAVMLALGLARYTQTRPAAKTLPIWTHQGSDCSGSYLLARAIVLGIAYDGYGNTGTIWDNYMHVSESDVQVGDAVLYGDGSVTKHVACVDDVKNETAIGFGAVPGRRSGWRYRSDLMGFRRGA